MAESKIHSFSEDVTSKITPVNWVTNPTIHAVRIGNIVVMHLLNGEVQSKAAGTKLFTVNSDITPKESSFQPLYYFGDNTVAGLLRTLTDGDIIINNNANLTEASGLSGVFTWSI